MYLIGGFKNGMKMMDIYRLHYNPSDRSFEWELFELKSPKAIHPEVRSSFGAVVYVDPASDQESILVFGGSGDNNTKFNDLWQFNLNQSSWY